MFVTFSLLQKLEAIYRRFAPQKLGKVTELLARYAGREDTLLRLARRKYVDAGSKGGDNAEVVLHSECWMEFSTGMDEREAKARPLRNGSVQRASVAYHPSNIYIHIFTHDAFHSTAVIRGGHHFCVSHHLQSRAQLEKWESSEFLSRAEGLVKWNAVRRCTEAVLGVPSFTPTSTRLNRSHCHSGARGTPLLQRLAVGKELGRKRPERREVGTLNGGSKRL